MYVKLIESMIEIWKFKKKFIWIFFKKTKKLGKIKENDLSVFDFESLWIYHAYDILVLNQEFENGKKCWLEIILEKPKTRANF